jgi:hypothetical protein
MEPVGMSRCEKGIEIALCPRKSRRMQIAAMKLCDHVIVYLVVVNFTALEAGS